MYPSNNNNNSLRIHSVSHQGQHCSISSWGSTDDRQSRCCHGPAWDLVHEAGFGWGRRVQLLERAFADNTRDRSSPVSRSPRFSSRHSPLQSRRCSFPVLHRVSAMIAGASDGPSQRRRAVSGGRSSGSVRRSVKPRWRRLRPLTEVLAYECLPTLQSTQG